jgi:phosphatidylinositol kinase/protein kinase (PI-3  family)
MHLTFLEHYPHPSTWYGKRLAYTRSAAVSSIVGYVMGIGDRHPQNIMFDSRTAELLHIDFGIAFEQVRKKQLMSTALRCVTVAYAIIVSCMVVLRGL